MEFAGAIVMNGYGGPEVLQWQRVRLRALGAREVRLRTEAAAVNRADLEIRSGNWPVQKADPFPYTPGLEVLGVVEEVGPQVQTVIPGHRVITMMQRLGGIHGERPGAYGEVVTVDADVLAVVPDDLDPRAVAALGLAAVTALEGVRRLSPRPGDRVVVHGAGGGVGSVAVSLLRSLGAQVVAVVRTDRQVPYAQRLGAHEVLVLPDGDLLAALGARSVDAVLETLGARTFFDSVAVLRLAGRLCLVGALTGPRLTLEAWDLMQDLVLTGYSSENLTGDSLRADIAEIAGALRNGTLQVPDYRTMPMRDAAAAHRLLEAGGVTGRVLLVPEG